MIIFNRFFFFLVKKAGKLPSKVIYAISDIASFLMYYVIRYRRNIVFENLRTAFPQKSDKEIKQIARKTYTNLSDNMLEMFRFVNMTQEMAMERFCYKNIELFDRLINRPYNTLMVVGHYGNWEWISITEVFFPGARGYSLYQKIKNPFFEKKIKEIREHFGLKLIESQRAVRELVKLTPNFKNIVAMVADQGPVSENVKHWLNFLNHDTAVHIGPHIIATKLNFDVVFIDIQRVKRGFYNVVPTTLYMVGEEPIPEDYKIVDRFFEQLEKQIRNKPENWLWTHRRWKRTRESVEKHIEYLKKQTHKS